MRALKSRLPLGSSLASLTSRAHADAPHPLAPLRARRERPQCRGAAEKADELAAFQLIELHSVPPPRAGLQNIGSARISQEVSEGYATAEGWHAHTTGPG